VTRTDARIAGFAGIAGGLGWAALAVATFAADRGLTPVWYGPGDLLTPVALGLAAVGLAGYRARTGPGWGRLAAAGFAALFAALVGATAGSAAYVALDALYGWTLSVWAYSLALVGATAFGAGLLRARMPPRAGAALLAGIPVGLGASFALALALGDEAAVPLAPSVLLGAGLAALGRWTAVSSEE